MSFEIPESIKVYSQFVHPVMMWVLFALTCYALYLGIKVRRTRSAEAKKESFNQRKVQYPALSDWLTGAGIDGGGLYCWYGP
jgi:hypothetical protein